MYLDRVLEKYYNIYGSLAIDSCILICLLSLARVEPGVTYTAMAVSVYLNFWDLSLQLSLSKFYANFPNQFFFVLFELVELKCYELEEWGKKLQKGNYFWMLENLTLQAVLLMSLNITENLQPWNYWSDMFYSLLKINVVNRLSRLIREFYISWKSWFGISEN